ncbi:hypothetical protein AAU57_11910 [Nonlabens sp. YIK11]|uniref:hypothetical protein n=1 Tax=Nonlabens sp. YIK11 TaxID=1453349 RepID=UPI0006DC06CB|nr:hypothetical protein [Nonlabens sp. YIK11]KQC33953.1 hypothetical protein AAU57_11910 [Nonlabens sp. YIK11]
MTIVDTQAFSKVDSSNFERTSSAFFKLFENCQNKNQEQKTIPAIRCSVLNKDGSYSIFESENLGASKLTKANFDLVVKWLEKESEKYLGYFQ